MINTHVLLTFLLFAFDFTFSARVTKLRVTSGSRNGGTRIVMDGEGFAVDQFNFGDGKDHLGNKVNLVDDTKSYPCDIHKDGCTETQIMCDTRPMDVGTYTIKLMIDGVKVPQSDICSWCTFRVNSHLTPTIDDMEPRITKPGSMLLIRGKIFSDKYGSHIDVSSNGRSESILRAYVGGSKCELRDQLADNLYGLSLDNARSVYGTIKCRMEGTFIGTVNVTYIVSGNTGRSLANTKLIRVMPGQKLGMLLTHAEITGLNVHRGSVEGGTRLIISGANFDNTTAAPRVYVGGVECKSQYINATEIRCHTPKRPEDGSDTWSLFPGSIGILKEFWNDSRSTHSEIRAKRSSDAGYIASHSNKLSYISTQHIRNSVRMKGFFVPPYTGEYSFYVKADDSAALYFSKAGDPRNATEIASCPRYERSYKKYSTQKSERIHLEADKSYYMELVGANLGGPGTADVAVHYGKTPYTKAHTQDAIPERQRIEFSSSQQQEIQVVKMLNWTTQAPIKEIQLIEITGTGDGFSLGFDGMWTEMLPVNVGANVIEGSLNDLPTIKPDSVTVSVSSNSATRVLKVVFNTDRGDVKRIEVKKLGASHGLEINVTEDTSGVASMKNFQLTVDDVVTAPIPRDASPDKVKEAIESLFWPVCPTYLTNMKNVLINMDFVGHNPSIPSGNLVSDRSFCGRQSVKNPVRIATPSRHFDVTGKGPVVCFAYVGSLQSKLKVAYSYTEKGERLSAKTELKLDTEFENDDRWHYKCHNLYTLMSNQAPKHMFGLKIKSIDIVPNNNRDVWIDMISVIPELKIQDAEIDRMVERRRSPPPQRISGVNVTGVSGGYRIAFNSDTCAHEYPLLQPYNSLPTTANRFMQMNWPVDSLIEVNRESTATPGLSGTFDMEFKGRKAIGIPVNASESEFGQHLMNNFGTGKTNVHRTGSCRGFSYRIIMDKVAGDQPEFKVLLDNVHGPSPAVSVNTIDDGGLLFDPIPGWMLRTAEPTPQVMVLINNVPSICSGNCSFEWDDLLRPTVTSISPTTGTEGTVLTLSGSSLPSINTDVEVNIGPVTCEVTAATPTSISCLVGDGPAGIHDVTVIVEDVGKAFGSVTFTYQVEVTSFEPSSGVIAGGTVLNITGKGFAKTKNSSVLLGSGNVCDLRNVTFNQIICVTPAVTSTGAISLKVIVGDEEAVAGTQFTYVTAHAFITAINTSAANVDGSTEITINGTGFGDSVVDPKCIRVGDNHAVIVSYTDTEITAILPQNKPGSYPLLLNLAAGGFADLKTNRIPDIEYKLQVDVISPDSGSMYGGTDIIIKGDGFNLNSSLNEVKFGDVPCKITAVVDEQTVKCRMEYAGRTHRIDNLGDSPDFGIGYMWNPQIMKIHSGDKVRWNWRRPEPDVEIDYMVCQTKNAIDEECMEGGFRSGRAPSGGFEHIFRQPGIYYYTSGFINRDQTVSFHGQIRVTSRNSSVGDLSFKVKGIAAEHYLQSGVSISEQIDNCSVINTTVPGCNEPDEAKRNSTFAFSFSRCMTPRLTEITHQLNTESGYYECYLVGEGFGNDPCQTEIKIRGELCNITVIDEDFINCTVTPVGPVPIGQPMKLVDITSVVVNNRGIAEIDLNDTVQFTPVPLITSVLPQVGSLAGGTEIEIRGLHLADEDPSATTQVTVHGFACSKLKRVSHNSVVCVTSASAVENSGDIELTVTNAFGRHLANCSAIGGCRFSYNSSYTPNVTNLVTDVIDNKANLTISGTNFGNNAESVSISFDDIDCAVSSMTDTEIKCGTEDTVVGKHQIQLSTNLGFAFSDSNVQIDSVAPTIFPIEGGINGGNEILITGFGFKASDTKVKIDGTDCPSSETSSTQVKCKVPKHSVGSVDVSVTSNSISFPNTTYSYATALTPSVTSISPTRGNGGASLTITGTGFTNVVGDAFVHIGQTVCAVTSASTTQIVCTVGVSLPGTFPVDVMIVNKGLATSSAEFEYVLEVSSFSPTTGSFGGGQTITLNGAGFSEGQTNITICDKACEIENVTPSQLTCISPFNSGSGTVNCELSVHTGSKTFNSTTRFTYSDAQTPMIISVSPERGGTGGGTTLTITGQGFGIIQGDVSVNIGGSVCTVSGVTETSITCSTAAHTPSVKATVDVKLNGKGLAKQPESPVEFYYIDVWSSIYTWGGIRLPEDGDMVVVGKGQVLLVDIPITPIIKMILIKGGKLMFDAKDIELNAEKILILDGGVLEVGTESQPFQHQGIITLHGNMRAIELPIYGAKGIGIREGSLELHGKHVPYTWTKLDQTVNAGGDTITVQDAVSWTVGDEIVIATTGLRHSQKETEVRKITAVSGKVLTLDQPLEYQHLGVSVTYGGKTIDMRGEVGLLTRNVKVRGSNDQQWNDKIPACKDGFNTGEFATQTCFQGRFGEETGSDQFGSQIIFHAPRKDEDLVQGHIEYAEITYAGQAFKLGRYPVHFHLNGNMNGSYVRGCAIHNTFNRAVNIHGTHNVMVERNVVYNVMGGALFLEDGIETGNTFQYNLVLFVKSSTSLLNDDITPASIWITNPDNTVRHNAAAGGTHFGVWYRMKEHPEGPSYTPSVCPRNIPVREFSNNTAHSFGWFGLWIFKKYTPRVGGTCASKTPAPAVFDGLTTWRCEKGAEWVDCGAVQFNNFVSLQNEKAGIEAKFINDADLFSENGALVKNGILVGEVPEVPGGGLTHAGLIVPLSPGLLVKDTQFINFDKSGSVAIKAAIIDGTSSDFSGGFGYHFTGTTFTNSPKKASLRWAHEARFYDLDGSLSGGTPGSMIVTKTPLLPSRCMSNADFSINFPMAICPPDVSVIRFAFKSIAPAHLLGKDIVLTNQHGSLVSPFAFKRMTHKPGWMVELVAKEQYTFHFKDVDHVTNITYSGAFFGLKTDDWVIINHNFTQTPDRMQIIQGDTRNASTTALTYDNNINGDYHLDGINREFTYIISGRSSRRRKRGLTVRSNPNYAVRSVYLKVYRCYFKGCITPKDPGSVPPPEERPENATLWSKGDGSPCWNNGTRPKAGEDLIVKPGCWILIDVENIPPLGKIEIQGALELDPRLTNDKPKQFVLNCSSIFINNGRLVVGWKSSPFMNEARIILRGNHNTPDFPMSGGPNLGAKFIGVFGGLDLHGKPHTSSWTRLSRTAAAGSNVINLQEQVDWKIGDRIIVTSTSKTPKDTEVKTITNIDSTNTSLTLDSPLLYPHTVNVENVPGTNWTLNMSCEVGLLTHNIKIEGGDYPNLIPESFGARIIVGTYSIDETKYTGYARLSEVEFYHTGQEGWYEPYDPRYSLTFLDVGDVTEGRPSSVRHCSFHHGFSPAIGLFGINKLQVEDNVIYRTVGAGIVVRGTYNTLQHNLVTLSLWPGSYNGRAEATNLIFQGAIETNYAELVTLKDNVVVGSERAAYRIRGEPCDDPSVPAWSGNVARSSMFGALVLPTDIRPECMRISGIQAMKSFRYGIYCQTSASPIINNVVVAENSVGILLIVIKPPIQTNKVTGKTAQIQNSLVVGRTSVHDCNDTMKRSAVNVRLSKQANSWKTKTGGDTGIAWSIFLSKDNIAPEFPFPGDAAYPAFSGMTKISGVTFYKFGTDCTGERSAAISTPPIPEDVLFPIEIDNAKMVEVESGSEVFLLSPNVGKVNPADCVDMDCDAKRKCIVRDLDGSFLRTGKQSAILPDSAYEWDGDPRHGFGDYRIPKLALIDVRGNRLNVADVCPKKGIYREGCQKVSSWNGYKCSGANTDYEFLILASLDHDTETRRLSPIAFIGDGYVDLLNGPQDHGWCSGYTCQKRVSTFNMVVLNGKHYDVYMSGVNPQKTMFQLLHVADDYKVSIGLSYPKPYRLDVYADGEYIHPMNRQIRPDGKEVLPPPKYPGEFNPPITADAGSNYFDQSKKVLYFIAKGNARIEIKVARLVIISMTLPAMTVDEFFGSQVLENLAKFLNIPASKIMVVNPVSASGRRRKRAVGDLTLQLQIGEPPSASSNSSNSSSSSSGGGGSSDVLDFSALSEISSKITNAAQTQSLGALLNTTITNLAVAAPIPPADSPEWSAQSNVTAAESASTPDLPTIQVPSQLVLVETPVAGEENAAFSTQPKLRMKDSAGQFIDSVGSNSLTWMIQATLKYGASSDNNAALIGSVNISFVDGWANFTDLGISYYGGDYNIEFQIVNPVSSSNMKTTTSQSLTVSKMQLTLSLTVEPSDSITVDNEFSVIVNMLRDDGSNADLSWRSGTAWPATVSICSDCFSTTVTLGGSTVQQTNTSGTVRFDGLTVSTMGKYVLSVTMTSSDSSYSFNEQSSVITIVPATSGDVGTESTKSGQLRFPGDYSQIVGTKPEYCSAALWNVLQPKMSNVTIMNITCSPGSIMATFTVQGSSTAVSSSLTQLYSLIQSGMSFTLNGYTLTADKVLLVDGSNYGVSSASETDLELGMIIGIAVASAIVLVVVIGLIVYFAKCHQNKGKSIETEYGQTNSDQQRKASMAVSRLMSSPVHNPSKNVSDSLPSMVPLPASYTQTNGSPSQVPISTISGDYLYPLYNSAIQHPSQLPKIDTEKAYSRKNKLAPIEHIVPQAPTPVLTESDLRVMNTHSRAKVPGIVSLPTASEVTENKSPVRSLAKTSPTLRNTSVTSLRSTNSSRSVITPID